MGGSSYSRDVGTSSSSGGFSSGGTSSSRAKRDMSRSSATSATSPYRRDVKSNAESPVVINLDGTGSNIEFARIVYDKAPMLYGQIEQQGYLKDFNICFSITGDAYSDRAPLQVADFAKGIKLDDKLKSLYLEGCGGGQQMETYELSAYFFANKCKMPKAKMPFLFMIGDEAPYPTLDRQIMSGQLGVTADSSYDTKEVFQQAFKTFQGNVFFLQNPYCGGGRDSLTRQISEAWYDAFGPEHRENVIQVRDEKGVVDQILGIIAMTSNARSLDAYKADMKARGQTDRRIATVGKSLEGYAGSIVPYVGASVPMIGGKQRKSGAKKLVKRKR